MAGYTPLSIGSEKKNWHHENSQLWPRRKLSLPPAPRSCGRQIKREMALSWYITENHITIDDTVSTEERRRREE